MKSIILYIWEGLWPIPPLNQIVTHLKEIKLLSQGRCTGTCSLPQLRWHKATPKARKQGKKKVLLFMWQVIVWVAAVDNFNNHNKDNHTPLKSYSLCLQQHYLLSNFCSFCPPRNKIVNTVKLCQPIWILLPIKGLCWAAHWFVHCSEPSAVGAVAGRCGTESRAEKTLPLIS